MKKIIFLFLFVAILVLTSCAKLNDDFYQIKDYETVGIIKNYDENKIEDRLKKRILKQFIPEMSCDVATVSVEMLGTSDNRNYAIYCCAGYNNEDTAPRRCYSTSGLAEIRDIDNDDYTLLSDTAGAYFWEQHLPNEIVKNINNKFKSENFSWYVYTVGKMEDETLQDAAEYINK